MGKLWWLAPGVGVKRWYILLGLGIALVILSIESFSASLGIYKYFGIVGLLNPLWGFVLGAAGVSLITVFAVNVISGRVPITVDAMKRKALRLGPKVAALGGGTGLSTLLRGLKNFTSNISAIVTVTDDGGSSGRLRRDMGVLPPGDIRNCIVALAEEESLLTKLLTFRFEKGSELAGHSLGNLLIVAMSEMMGSFPKGIEEISKVLRIRGKVFPLSLSSVDLVAEFEDGDVRVGETKIVEKGSRIKNIYIQSADGSRPTILKDAIKAIEEADIVVLGPGSLYTSVIPHLLVPEIREAIRRSKALKFYVVNVMTQPGETDGFCAEDHIREVERYLGQGVIDFYVVNTKMPANEKLLERYKDEGAKPVVLRDPSALDGKVILGDFMSERELIRHDPLKLARAIIETWRRESLGK